MYVWGVVACMYGAWSHVCMGRDRMYGVWLRVWGVVTCMGPGHMYYVLVVVTCMGRGQKCAMCGHMYECGHK